MENFVRKYLVWIYAAALLALACLAISSYFVARNALFSQIDNTYLVNVTAHQRTLSQRIVLKSERALLFPAGAQHIQAVEDLELAVEAMTQASHDLSSHISSLARSDPLAEEIYTHYYRGKKPLSSELTDFLYTARVFLATPTGAKRQAPDLQHMYEGSEKLLLSLGTLVDLFSIRRLSWNGQMKPSPPRQVLRLMKLLDSMLLSCSIILKTVQTLWGNGPIS